MPSSVEMAALSDVGCVRKNNEDSFGHDFDSGLFVVCDGMGGMAAGEVASALACTTVIESFRGQPRDAPLLERLDRAIHAANDAVRLAAQRKGQQGMGTTMVCAAVHGAKLLIGNVGDSRAYLLQHARWTQLTIDHSYLNELVRQGSVKAEDLHRVNLKGMESVISRAIGASDEVEPDFFSIDLEDGDGVLLTSDGLTRYVDSADLVRWVDPADLTGSCERLIKAAKEAGGADNITGLLLRFRA